MSEVGVGAHSVYMDTMTIPIVRCPEIVSVSGASGYGSMEEYNNDSGPDSSKDPGKEFKSEFAKQLEHALGTVEQHQNYLGDVSLHQISSPARHDKQAEQLRLAKEEFMRIKQENLRLKYEIEKHKLDEDRYSKLQYEVEHLTGKLHKMEEQTREYEHLTGQLETYVSMFSNQLSISTPGLHAAADNVSRYLRNQRSMSAHMTRDNLTLPRHLHKDTCRHSRDTSTLPRSHQYFNDSSIDTSDGDYQSRGGFHSLPRHHHRSRKYNKNRSRTRANSSFKMQTDFNIKESEDFYADLDGKKKSKLLDFLSRVKIFLLRRKDYDIQTLV